MENSYWELEEIISTALISVSHHLISWQVHNIYSIGQNFSFPSRMQSPAIEVSKTDLKTNDARTKSDWFLCFKKEKKTIFKSGFTLFKKKKKEKDFSASWVGGERSRHPGSESLQGYGERMAIPTDCFRRSSLGHLCPAKPPLNLPPITWSVPVT